MGSLKASTRPPGTPWQCMTVTLVRTRRSKCRGKQKDDMSSRKRMYLVLLIKKKEESTGSGRSVLCSKPKTNIEATEAALTVCAEGAVGREPIWKNSLFRHRQRKNFRCWFGRRFFCIESDVHSSNFDPRYNPAQQLPPPSCNSQNIP